MNKELYMKWVLEITSQEKFKLPSEVIKEYNVYFGLFNSIM